MVFARSAAMAFNRYIDRDIDKRNVRTAVREIPSGIISKKNAVYFIILNCAGFIIASGLLNKLCLWLSPVALAIILGYSYTKRFTWLCHFILGIGLSLAPIGAYIAVTEQFATLPILFGVIVLTWVSGFDVIYALQDEEFDRENKLFSIPVVVGKRNALIISSIIHLITAITIYVAGNQQYFGILYWLGAGIFTGLLIYQHMLVKPGDLSKVNLAFFTTNGIASIIFGAMIISDIFMV